MGRGVKRWAVAWSPSACFQEHTRGWRRSTSDICVERGGGVLSVQRSHHHLVAPSLFDALGRASRGERERGAAAARWWSLLERMRGSGKVSVRDTAANGHVSANTHTQTCTHRRTAAAAPLSFLNFAPWKVRVHTTPCTALRPLVYRHTITPLKRGTSDQDRAERQWTS